MYGRQAGSNQGQQMLRRHGSLRPYARVLQWSVCWAESLHAPSSLSPLSSRISAFTPEQSATEFTWWKNTLCFKQVFSPNNSQQYTAPCEEAVVLSRSYYPSSQAVASVNLQGKKTHSVCFDGFYFRASKYSDFFFVENTDVIITKTMKMKRKCW